MGYVRKKDEKEWINYTWLSLMGRKTLSSCRQAYKAYAESMIGKKDDILAEALGASRYAIGDKEFIEETESDLKEMRLEKGVCGDISFPKGPEIALEAIDETVAREFRIKKDDLHFHGHRAGIAKTVAVELCCMLSGKSQREIAGYYGYKTDGGVARQRKVARQEMTRDDSFTRRLAKLKKKLLKAKI